MSLVVSSGVVGSSGLARRGGGADAPHKLLRQNAVGQHRRPLLHKGPPCNAHKLAGFTARGRRERFSFHTVRATVGDDDSEDASSKKDDEVGRCKLEPSGLKARPGFQNFIPNEREKRNLLEPSCV